MISAKFTNSPLSKGAEAEPELVEELGEEERRQEEARGGATRCWGRQVPKVLMAT